MLWKKHLSWGNDFLEYVKMAGRNAGQQSGIHRALEVSFWRSRNVVKEFNKPSFLMENSLINNDLLRSDCLSFRSTGVHFWAWPLRVALRAAGWACSEGTAASRAQDCLLFPPEGFQQQHRRWGFNLTQNYCHEEYSAFYGGSMPKQNRTTKSNCICFVLKLGYVLVV